MTKDELREVLRLHGMWVREEPGGIRANLPEANLSWANLKGTNLSRADLRGANLFGADLRGADLSGACLRGADLSKANLTGADLTGANLTRACLRGANLTNAILPPLPVTLPPGDFIGWKKVRGNVILELRIFESSRRTGNLVGRKCRTDQVLVLSAQRLDGSIITDRKTFYSLWKPSFIYTVGELVEEHSFSDDIRVECERGIHFFLSREEAVEFTL